MAFDPSAPGPFSVATRNGVVVDRVRDDRALPFEVWHPVGDDGRPHPLILYSHASGGGRRQSSFLGEHLASHGYVVAAVDHVGNTAADFAASAARAAAGVQSTPAERDAHLRRIIADRVPDIRFLLDQLLAGAAGPVAIDEQRIGIVGWSFGGWAAFAMLEVDDRLRALVALAPAGNSRPLPGIIPAERDRFTPLAGIYELFERTPSRKRLFILRGADHGHFADDVGEPGGCSAEAAHLFTRTLTLAHLDAELRDNGGGRQFFANDPTAVLRAQGVDAIEYGRPF
jgi:dienelactone hydrolase